VERAGFPCFPLSLGALDNQFSAYFWGFGRFAEDFFPFFLAFMCEDLVF
jgi:hypothetical protein